MSDFEPSSEQSKPSEQEFFYFVDSLSFQRPLNIEIPYDTHQGTVQIYPSAEADKGVTQQPEAMIRIQPPEQESEPPSIEARFFQFSGGVELKRQVEVTKRLKNFEIIDVNGFPIMTIFDHEKKKVRLVSITPALLSQHKTLNKRINHNESTVRQLDMEEMFEKTYNDLNIRHLLNIFHEQGANFFSLEEAHEYWKNVFMQAMRESGVSNGTLLSFSESSEEQWAAHLAMLSTLHGYLAMNMDGEKRFWDQIINPEYKYPTDKQEILRIVQLYREKKISDFRERNWRIVQNWPEASEKPQRDAFEVILPEKMRDGDVVGVYTDPETGLQIAVRVRTNQNDGALQAIAPIVGGKRNKENPQFAKAKAFQESDFNYDQTTADNFGKYSEQVNISDQEEMVVHQHGWIDYAQKAVVIYDTPRGKKCIKLFLSTSLEDDEDFIVRPRVVIEPNHPLTDEMLGLLDQQLEKKQKGNRPVNIEVSAAVKAHEIASRVMSIGKTIELADLQFGINREKTKKVPLATTIDVNGKVYQEIFNEHYNLIKIVLEGYSPTTEGTVFDLYLDGMFGRDVRERLKDLQQRKKEVVQVDVVSEEEKLYRKKQGQDLSVKSGKAISPEEEQQFKELLKNNVKALYCLALLTGPDHTLTHSSIIEEETFVNILTQPLANSQEQQSLYADLIAREIAFLSGLSNMRAQFDYLRGKVGLVNFVRYLPVWRRICLEVLNVKKQAGLRSEQDLLKKSRFLSIQEQHDQEFHDRLQRLAVKIEETDEGKVPPWVLEKLGLKEK